MGSSGQSTGYTIDQSIRFNAADTAYMHRTPSSTGNRKTFTSSFWFKLGNVEVNTALPTPQVTHGAGSSGLALVANEGTLTAYTYYSGSWSGFLKTNRKFRDPSAWYHIVYVVDSTQAVASERIRIYVNGERETSFSTESYLAQNQDTDWNLSGEKMWIGRDGSGSGYDGEYYAAEIHWLDGYAYGPEYFGEFKEDTDIWIPKEYDGSYGTNGFYIDGSDSGTLGKNVASGNTFASFTSSGFAANDQMIDTPTNNFCTINSVYADDSGTNSVTMSEGNLKMTATSSGFDLLATTFLLPKSGKWYYEYTIGGGYDGFGFYIPSAAGTAGGANGLGQLSTAQGGGIQYRGWRHGGSYTTTFASYSSGVFSSGDIHQVAFDVDNGKLYYGISNAYQAADGGADGNPSSGTNHLFAFDFAGNDIIIAHMVATDSNPEHLNFGQNGTFNGTKTAQGNSDSNSIGNFFYAVPTGFLSLCTTNLWEKQ